MSSIISFVLESATKLHCKSRQKLISYYHWPSISKLTPIYAALQLLIIRYMGKVSMGSFWYSSFSENCSKTHHFFDQVNRNFPFRTLPFTVVVERFLTLSGLENFVWTNTYVSMNLIVRGYVYL